MIAKGIMVAATEMNLKIPLVVRLQGRVMLAVVAVQSYHSLLGNNQKKANAMISGSNLKMLSVEDFNIAAKTVCCRYII